MKTGAGAMDRRVQFRRAAASDDGFSQVETWADIGAEVWAAKTDISDGEKWRAQAVAASITTRFVVRYSGFSASITPKDRLVCEGREYEISGIKEIGRRDRLEMTAAARVDL